MKDNSEYDIISQRVVAHMREFWDAEEIYDLSIYEHLDVAVNRIWRDINE